MARTWGFWTRGKLEILRRYLDAFTTASKCSPTRIYVDLFAGGLDNEDRLTGESIHSSAWVALATDDPPFTTVCLFEREDKAAQLSTELTEAFPGRDLRVYGGDCNELLPQALWELRHLSRAPTFAFVDPNATEAKWSTLEMLAKFRRHSDYKTELFVLFAAPMFTRLLPVDGRVVRPKDAHSIDEMFGTSQWRHIYGARLDDEIKPSVAQDEYVNLMRWRLEAVLGYNWTHPIEIRNEQGTRIYFMIFATDHPAGTSIMSHIYKVAAEEFPAMRHEARLTRRQIEEKSKGVRTLFGDDSPALPIQGGERFYEHEPPTRPRFLAEN